MTIDPFVDTIGQEGLKQELYEAYVGARRAGLPLPHGLLISPPGYGKSDKFVPGISAMTGHEVVGPFGISLNMKLDGLIAKVSLGFAAAQAQGKQPMIALEELSNIGKPNCGRLLTLLSEGVFTTLTGDQWHAGIPGRDWFMVAACNDDGNFLDGLKSRLTFFRFDNYSIDELAEIGLQYGDAACGADLDYDELLKVAGQCDSPRTMKQRVGRMLALDSLGLKNDAAAVVDSLRLDSDGLHVDNRRCLVAVFDLGGRTAMAMLSKKLKTRVATVQGWVGELVERGFLHPPKSGNGGGIALTFAGQIKAAALKFGQ